MEEKDKRVMNDALFESGYTRTEEAVREAYLCEYFRRPVNIAFHAAGVLIVLASAALCAADGVDVDNLFPAAAVILSYAIVAYRHFRAGKKAVARDRETYGDALVEITMWVYEDYIHGEASHGASGDIEIANVSRAYETKNRIVLITKAGQINIFDKASFSKGTPEEFVSFLKKKGIRVR